MISVNISGRRLTAARDATPSINIRMRRVRKIFPIGSRWKKVNLTKRVEVEFTQENEVKKELRYCPVVLSGNGKIRPDVVLVKGVEERHSEGA